MFRRISRLAIAGLIALGTPAAWVTAAASANAATTSAAVSRANAVTTSASVSRPVAPHMTITRLSSRRSAASPNLFAGFCITSWSGRFVYSHCEGIGNWRQWATCSLSGFTYTSPPLFAPPIYDWFGACPAGQSVITANVQF